MLLALVVGVLLSCEAFAANASAKPTDLIREVVQNEVNSTGDRDYLYEVRNDGPSLSTVRVWAEVRDGSMARMLLRNGKPATAEQDQQWEQNARKFLADAPQLAKRAKQMRENDKQMKDMFRLLPDAFLYENDGTEANGRLVRLKFRPNPAFHPPTYPSRVMQGVEGLMVVDSVDKRFARIDANVFRDVEFGWGLLGRLEKGGHLTLEFQKINDGSWHGAAVHIHLSGRMLFKRFRQDQEERYWNYQRLPDGTTLPQVFEKLKTYPVPAVQTARKQ
jgi:hypothetical protein